MRAGMAGTDTGRCCAVVVLLDNDVDGAMFFCLTTVLVSSVVGCSSLLLLSVVVLLLMSVFWSSLMGSVSFSSSPIFVSTCWSSTTSLSSTSALSPSLSATLSSTSSSLPLVASLSLASSSPAFFSSLSNSMLMRMSRRRLPQPNGHQPPLDDDGSDEARAAVLTGDSATNALGAVDAVAVNSVASTARGALNVGARDDATAHVNDS